MSSPLSVPWIFCPAASAFHMTSWAHLWCTETARDRPSTQGPQAWQEEGYFNNYVQSCFFIMCNTFSVDLNTKGLPNASTECPPHRFPLTGWHFSMFVHGAWALWPRLRSQGKEGQCFQEVSRLHLPPGWKTEVCSISLNSVGKANSLTLRALTSPWNSLWKLRALPCWAFYMQYLVSILTATF